jgi:hypothetical protein
MNRHLRSTVLNGLAAMIFSLSFGQENFTPIASAQAEENPGPPPAVGPLLRSARMAA